MKKTAPKSKSQTRPTLVAFLLDRSGSMASCRDETIGGFNGYIKTLRDKGAKGTRFTFTQFDTLAIDVIHDNVALDEVDELSTKNYEPRGGTPLYDALGKTVRATEKSASDKFDVLFVTLTDGEENSSVEWNSNTIKELILEKEKSGWTFAHIGVGANGWAATASLSHGTSSASNVLRAARGKTGQGVNSVASASVQHTMRANKFQGATNFYAGHTPADIDKDAQGS